MDRDGGGDGGGDLHDRAGTFASIII